MKKNTGIFFILIFIITVFSAVFAAGTYAADIKYVYKERSELTKGVSLTSYDIFMSDRSWNRAYVAEADLNYPHLSLGVINDQNGISYLSNVLTAAQQHDTTAAINSDFFNWDSRAGHGSPIGAVFFDKKMISSPASSDGMYTIMQDENRNVFADIIDYKIVITAPNGKQKQIAGKNKASDLSQIMMYDKYYDRYSLGSTDTRYEVVVRDNIISEIRFSSEPVKLEDNMYILTALSDWDCFLTDNFKVGDEVKLDIVSSVDFNSLQLAAGAGAKILSDGSVPSSFSHVIGGTNPRSAFGISQNQKTVYLAAVDGRSSSSKGMTMTELGAFMKYIGAYNAVNLDGGGSTTLVTKDVQQGRQKLINTPSDGSVRKVASSIAVTSSVKKASGLYHLKITADGKNVFKNSRIKLSVEGFDEYYFPVNINPDDIVYSVSGVEGYFENGSFFPTSSGMAAISARMPNGAAADILIRVLDKPYKIIHEASSVEVNAGGARDFWLFVRDENGYIAHVPLCDMTVNFSESIAHVDGTAVVGDKNGSALMSAKFGDAVIYAAVYVGTKNTAIALPEDKTAADSLCTSSSVNTASRFAVFGTLRESDTLFNNLIMKKSLSKINADASSAFLLSTHATSNVALNMSIPVRTCYPFNTYTENSNTYIILDTEDNFMSAREWTWLIDELNAVSTKNLFVFMQTDLSFVSAKETKLLKDVLSDTAERGINVYTFCNGMSAVSEPENGVRYIKTAGFSDDITPYGFSVSKDSLKFVLVNIDSNNDVTYNFVPVY